jgi:hypothetical protein
MKKMNKKENMQPRLRGLEAMSSKPLRQTPPLG